MWDSLLRTMIFAQFEQESFPRQVTIRFLYSPYSDYLFYLLYREPRWFPLDAVLDLDSIPTVEDLIALPELVASLQIDSYRQIYPLLDDYRHPPGPVITHPKPRRLSYSLTLPSYESLVSVIREGEKHFPRFHEYWETEIEPLEKKLIGTWRRQLSESSPMHMLQGITGLRFPSTSLDVACIALHLAGSANYSPLGVYTTIFNRDATRPDLAWVLGHEATHLLISKYVGTDWTEYPLSTKAIDLIKKRGGTRYSIEETLCLFMQVKLSQECGYTDKEFRVSQHPVSVVQGIRGKMEQEWENYLTEPKKWPTIIDFMLYCATEAVEKMQ